MEAKIVKKRVVIINSIIIMRLQVYLSSMGYSHTETLESYNKLLLLKILGTYFKNRLQNYFFPMALQPIFEPCPPLY
jgi:hypothetical protein